MDGWIHVFPYQTFWEFPTRTPPNEGVECRWGGQNRDSRPISGFGMDDWLSVINSCDRRIKCITADADDDRRASVNHVYDSKGSTSF